MAMNKYNSSHKQTNKRHENDKITKKLIHNKSEMYLPLSEEIKSCEDC